MPEAVISALTRRKPSYAQRFKVYLFITCFQAIALAKRLDMTEREVNRWWRIRRSNDRVSSLDKFCEHCWKASFLICSTSYGFFILWDKEWFWDFDQCYTGYPHQVNKFIVFG